MKRRQGVSPSVPLSELPSGVYVRARGRLPHWEMEQGTYFVTFRLADSLPNDVAREVAVARAARTSTSVEWGRLEPALDRGCGACYLRVPAVAEAVRNAIHFLNGRSYELFAWTVMPNHVHLVARMLPAVELSSAMHQLKSFTAKEANRILQRCGTFWQREYFDRLLRVGEFDGAVNYVLNNPDRAGLRDWPWVGRG